MITKKVERFRDADFDEYSFLYSQCELAIQMAGLVNPPVNHLLDTLGLRGAPVNHLLTTLGLRGAPKARGPIAHNSRRDCTADANKSR
jgi:hypothetical protein